MNRNQITKLILFISLFFCISVFSAEVNFGSNQLTCTHEGFGTFEIQYTVVDIVISTEYYSDENAKPIPSWETLESHLNKIEFTSGKLVSPAGVKGTLEEVELKVLRNVWKGSAYGMINVHVSFPKDTFLTNLLSIDHNHPDEYETTELGAQSFVWLEKGVLAQLFFKCK